MEEIRDTILWETNTKLEKGIREATDIVSKEMARENKQNKGESQEDQKGPKSSAMKE